VFRVVNEHGGMPLLWSNNSPSRLSAADREAISRGLAQRCSLRQIAATINRAPSTVSREVNRNGGRERYLAIRAHRRAFERARRPRPTVFERVPALRLFVENGLQCRWSPQQISARLAVEFPDQAEMRVSHETIYQTLFVQGRGGLRKELARQLRSGRTKRRPHGRGAGGGGRISDMVMISQRPAEIDDRAVPGHWEGDLIIGADHATAIATLVERSTRFVMLAALPNGRSAIEVRDALAALVQRLPAQLARSLTWDQGSEMAEHTTFRITTGIDVYFCDPHSPWQRGTNENTNGLLRQYFPKSTPLPADQALLDTVATELNARPRQTLNWLTPSEAFNQLVATTA
jgi:IS30 family transposase